MRRSSIVIVLVVIAPTINVFASLPAHAGGYKSHRFVAHRTAKHTRELTVRRWARRRAQPITRDFDPVPLGGGPIVNFIRDIHEVYGHELPVTPRPAVQPWDLGDF